MLNRLPPESNKKTMNQIVSIFLICLVCSITCAQAQEYPYPDSIRVEFADHKAIVTFEMRHFKRDKEYVRNFPALLKDLVSPIKKSIPEQHLSTPHKIEVVFAQDDKKTWIVNPNLPFKPDQSTQRITITKQEPATTQLTVKDHTIVELLTPGLNITIQTNQFRVTIYSPDMTALESLTGESFDPVIAAVENDPGVVQLGRKGIISRLVYQNHAIAFSKMDFRFSGDMLGLHAGAGVGVFQDNVYPELNFSTALYFNNRFGVVRQRIMLEYELKFFSGKDTEGNYQTLTNSFLSLSYSRNFKPGRPRFFGAGVGYLLNSKGSIYNGKTMKFFLESDIGHPKINLVPEFYLTNDFKEFAFGLKLGYKF
jgi:hypothetical protein